MISLDTIGTKLKLKIIKSPLFKEDLEKTKKLSGRIPIYKLDEVTGVDSFQYWEIPKSELREILNKWQPEEIQATDSIQKLIENYHNQTSMVLDKIEGDLGLIRNPFAYQEEYIRLNPQKTKMLLAYQPGLGKSMCSLSRAKILGFKKLLIICPKAVLVNWRTEVRKTLEMDSLIFHGSKSQRKKLILPTILAPIVITTYEIAKELTFHPNCWDQIIIDEAHLIAHTSSKRYKDTSKILKNNPDAGIQLLSGTPILHKIPDLWSLVNIVSPEISGSFYGWKNRYEKVTRRLRKVLPNGRVIDIPIETKPQNIEELHERIKPIMVLMKRDEITDFKDTVEFITVDLTPRQKKLYQQITTSILVQLENRQLEIKNALSEVTRLLQVSEGAFNIEPEWEESSKLEYICHILDTTDEKVVVWSRFKPITEILYKKYKAKSVLYNGDVSDSRKTLAKWAFQGVDNEQDAKEYERLIKYNPDFKIQPGEAQFFFGVLDHRSALGINLHKARLQLFSSFHWNSNVNTQAGDRIRRIGQEADEVITQFIVAENTLEPRALEMILKNAQIQTEVLEGKASLGFSQIRDIIDLLKEKTL